MTKMHAPYFAAILALGTFASVGVFDCSSSHPSGERSFAISQQATTTSSQNVVGFVNIQGQGPGTAPNCLEVLGGNPNPASVAADNNTCSGATSQAVTLNDNGTITNYWGNCLDILNANYAAGTVDFVACNGTGAQQWIWPNNWLGRGVTIQSGGNTNYCLALASSSSNPGTAVGVAACSPGAQAQTWLPVPPQVPTESPPNPADVLPSPIGGNAIAIGVGPATPWAVGVDLQPYAYTGGTGSRAWTRELSANGTSRIAVSPEGTPWRIDAFGNMQIWKPGLFGVVGWNPQPAPGFPACAKDVGVGSNSRAFATGCDFDANGNATIYRWVQSSNTWQAMPNNRAVWIAVGPEGTTPWVINAANAVSYWNGSNWTPVAGSAQSIGVGPNNTAWIVGTTAGGGDGYPYAYSGAFLQASSFKAKTVSVGSDGTPWFLTSATTIFRWGSPWRFLGPSGVPFTGDERVWGGDVEDIDLTDFATGGRLVVGTAGGGVWEYDGGWLPMADTAFAPGPSPNVASVSQKPGDPNKTIVVATGVYAGNLASFVNGGTAGNGIWQGTRNGKVWQWTPLQCSPSCPQQFTKIRYGQSHPNNIYASSPNGFFVSTNGGAFNQATFTSTNNPQVTDFAVDEANSYVYAAVAGVGIAVSTDNGSSFPTVLPLPQGSTLFNATFFQFAKVALAQADSNCTMYMTINKGNDFNGVFVTHNIRPGCANFGTSPPQWTETSLQGCAEFDGCSSTAPGYVGNDMRMRSQFGHDGAIAVSPTDPNTALAAGVDVWRTTTAGGTAVTETCNACVANPAGWTVAQPSTNHASTPPVHADKHAIVFDTSGKLPGVVFMGTDGGLYASGDGGQTWTNAYNTLPAMQDLSVGVNVNGTTTSIVASAWDVGTHWSTDNGATWHSAGGLDDDWQSARPISPSEWFSQSGDANIHESTDQGSTWSTVLVGGTSPDIVPLTINDVVQVFTGGNIIPLGKTMPTCNASCASANVNICCGLDGVWQLDDGSGQVAQYGPPFQDSNANTTGPGAVTAVTYNNDTYVLAGKWSNGNGRTLQISKDGGAWREIGSGLPANNINRLQRDSPSGFGGAPANVYVLTLNGQVFADSVADLATSSAPNWINLTGNLPSTAAQQFTSILVDPTRGTVFVGSTAGVFKTTNSCVAAVLSTKVACWPTVWQPWGDGFPMSPPSVAAATTHSTIVTWLDGLTQTDGRFFIYASIWERGIWMRDATSDDP